MRLICLLPVRNGALTLERYFSSVALFCDGVVALDDGSTDETAQRLAAEPSLLNILTNPRRESYQGWDDRANRSQLLAAAADFKPDWIMWLDADEEIPPFDAVRIRQFLETQGQPDTAYGFEVLRLVKDHEHFDSAKLWVYRLLPFKTGYELPPEKFHFEPVPLQIPRENWRRTRLRIAHSAGLTAELRKARLQKYREVDPLNVWQQSYDQIVSPVGHVWELKPLPAGVDLLIP